jgi:hypothetical protein
VLGRLLVLGWLLGRLFPRLLLQLQQRRDFVGRDVDVSPGHVSILDSTAKLHAEPTPVLP